jgi:hypothetical protein
MAEAAVGFADHSGWAIAVAVVRTGDWFDVVARERLDIVEPGWTLPGGFGARQPYHAVAEMGADRRLVEDTIEAAAAGSAAAIRRIAESVARGGHQLVAAGVPAGAVALPRSLDAILVSHALLHAAEGELFREALAEGASRCGLAISRMPRKEVAADAAASVGLPRHAFEMRLRGMRDVLGPPWQADHRLAMAAAVLALRARPEGGSTGTSGCGGWRS